MANEEKDLHNENQQPMETSTNEDKDYKTGTSMMVSAALIMVASIWLLDSYATLNVKLILGSIIFVAGLVVIYFGYKKRKGSGKSK